MFFVCKFARHLSFTEKLLFYVEHLHISLIFSFLIRLFIFELGTGEIFASIYKNTQLYISVLFLIKVLNLGTFFLKMYPMSFQVKFFLIIVEKTSMV